MQIGALSSHTGCNIETIRYYERVGLLPKPARRGNYRQYASEDADRLTFIRRARELGFTLDEIRALLDLSLGGPGTCAQAREIAAAHLAEVKRRVSDLKRMERVLAETVSACSTGEHAGCPLIETLSRPGARIAG
jgi:MerR family mercuric resistance operon transcriptional regulator